MHITQNVYRHFCPGTPACHGLPRQAQAHCLISREFGLLMMVEELQPVVALTAKKVFLCPIFLRKSNKRNTWLATIVETYSGEKLT